MQYTYMASVANFSWQETALRGVQRPYSSTRGKVGAVVLGGAGLYGGNRWADQWDEDEKKQLSKQEWEAGGTNRAWRRAGLIASSGLIQANNGALLAHEIPLIAQGKY